MTAQVLPNLGLSSGYMVGEDGWQAPMNANLRMSDALTQPRVVDKDSGTPPGSLTPGVLYIVGPSATGAWAGNEGKLALVQTGDDTPSLWRFITPKSGWRVYVIDEAKYYRHNGSAWLEDTVGGGEANTASNIGSGAGLYANKSGSDLRFKSLAQAEGVAISASADTVTLRTVYISASDPGAVGAGVIWVTP